MPSINRESLQLMPEEKIQSHCFRPDIFFYTDKRYEYEGELLRLANAKYLYTDGQDIKPVSIFRFAFERFKGWLGFYNHCHSDIVNLAIYKYAYYGYLSGYSQDNLPALQKNNPQLDSTLLTKFSRDRENKLTNHLQQELVLFYVDHVQPHIVPDPENYISKEYIFGNSWIDLSAWEEIPKLDPQNDLIIEATVTKLDGVGYTYLRDSKYAIAVAEKKLGGVKSFKEFGLVGKLAEKFLNATANVPTNEQAIQSALRFAPSIMMKDKDFFILYFLERKEFDKAFQLIEMHEDISKAREYLLKHFDASQILEYVKKDSPLAVALSQHYLSKSPRDIKVIQFVENFNSQLANQFPAQAVTLLVSQKKFSEANEIVKTKEITLFNPSDLKTLAKHFEELSKKKHEEGSKLVKAKKWSEAQKPCAESVVLMKDVLALQSSTERMECYFARKRYYAELIIDKDIGTNSIEFCNKEEIVKAINLLRDCHPTSKSERKNLQSALAKGLMRQVDNLIFTITPTEYEERYSGIKHRAEQDTNIRMTITVLERLIEVLTNPTNPDLNVMLGKAYFLLGDVIHHFDVPGKNCTPYFEAARKTVPKNPFYLLRCSELATDEEEQSDLRSDAMELLKKLKYQSGDWLEWDKTRWQRDKISFTKLEDIHTLKVTQPSERSGIFKSILG